jgi:hypothetical protein
MISSHINEIRDLMQKHEVSYGTAYRWLRGDTQAFIARHVERKKLRDACAANGVPMSVAHQRRYEGYPIDALSMPLKERSSERKERLIAWCLKNGSCSVAQTRSMFGWSHERARACLCEWARQGSIVRVRTGVYDVPGRNQKAAS